MKQQALLTTSWDDGNPLDFRVAEMLHEHGLTGTFYIPRNAATGTMSAAQVRQLSEMVEIGSHTIDHTFLDEVDEDTARLQIIDSKKWVEDLTGNPCPMFCPPGGKFADRDLEIIRDAGYSALRSVELLSLDYPRDLGRGLSLLPTTIHAFPQPPQAYIKNALKRRNATNLWRFITHGLAMDWTRIADSMLDFTVTRGGVFHLWGHSWELQETAQWNRLERVFQLMSIGARSTRCVTNGELVGNKHHAIAA
ncbi:MAG: polysaccharide deacetylase family protein [Phycisphaerae bacterium]|nr:polysaccharide deacetylase family protein [Phycisphaerae bacterium]